MTRSTEQYIATFKPKMKDGKFNASASHFHFIVMHGLYEWIEQIGEFELLTPATSSYIPRSQLSEELGWWWGLKKRVFEAVVPDRAFGTEDRWRVVS